MYVDVFELLFCCVCDGFTGLVVASASIGLMPVVVLLLLMLAQSLLYSSCCCVRDGSISGMSVCICCIGSTPGT